MTAMAVRTDTGIQEIEVAAYTVPTDAPEGDGTLAWNSTTIVVVHAHGPEQIGLGYTYADVATARLIWSKLAGIVRGKDLFAPQAAWEAMVAGVRNLGRPGIGSMAIAAVDLAVWDLKARTLGLPLCDLLGMARESVPVYGSGGFTTYSTERLVEQLAGWVDRGIPRVKMKVGYDRDADPERVRRARAAIGADTQLFTDANGAYTRKQALELAHRFRAEAQVSWFEEPVSSDDLEGLRLLRDRVPASVEIAAGEYGYDAVYFERMLAAGAVDVLQADVTRCAGITELLAVDAMCRARSMPLSLHCGPAIHLHPGLALGQLVHLEYFHDHVRIESLLFDGVPAPVDGALHPDTSRPGNGLELKRADAQRYEA